MHSFRHQLSRQQRRAIPFISHILWSCHQARQA
uniref:Uncharacterized protein n=1 Tax=Erwinia amylovora ATCC BAA-2158 TaxID=889211 RepID=E5B5Y4_ERWAM|nr:hypothetical protein predicted by Glimmer/Critica [Erwinia amylovora ATCC BAA-2158]